MTKEAKRVRKETVPKHPLVRFVEDSYCEQFVSEGRVRFGSVAKYSKFSGSRADGTESIAMFRNEYGGSSTESVVNEAAFILSCSKANSKQDTKKLHHKFNEQGNFFLEIFNPELFLTKIKSAVIDSTNKESEYLNFVMLHPDNYYWVDVEYSKGNTQNNSELDYDNRCFFQKPPEQLSPAVVSTYNGLQFDRPSGLSGLMAEGDSLFAPHWPEGVTPINYEEEQECRLVLDGYYKMVVEKDGLIRKSDDADLNQHKISIFPDKYKLSNIDLICGDLSDCVRIQDIRKL